MTPTDQAIYKILLWSLPVLLAILGFVGALAVHALMSMNKNIQEIKEKMVGHSITQDDHEKRLDRIESIVLIPKSN
jgi:hypothetical protein